MFPFLCRYAYIIAFNNITSTYVHIVPNQILHENHHSWIFISFPLSLSSVSIIWNYSYVHLLFYFNRSIVLCAHLSVKYEISGTWLWTAISVHLCKKLILTSYTHCSGHNLWLEVANGSHHRTIITNWDYLSFLTWIRGAARNKNIPAALEAYM